MPVLTSSVVAGSQSVLWSTTVIGGICQASGNNKCIDDYDSGFVNPNITVKYSVRVTDTATGAVIACGSTVPANTTVRYEFVPHVFEDIYWFATAAFYDSPYGDWVAGAGHPGGNICIPKNYVGHGAGDDDDVYASLSVDPPVKSLSVSNATCTDISGGKSCVLATAGTATASFDFAPTIGYYYLVSRDGSSYCTNASRVPPAHYSSNVTPRRWTTNGVYTLQVPTQSISCPITVGTEDPTQKPPTTPTLTSNGACVAGTPHTVTFSSTDENNDQLHYGVDWNNDSSIDQWVPPTGYVAGGLPQTASRTYATAGTKSVQVLAQDEGGLTSEWATTSFSCAADPTPTDTTAGLEGNDTGNEGTDPGTFLPAGPDLTLRVIPSLVRPGNTTRVNWSATGVTSCLVTAPNGDTWNKVTSILGGEVSRPITAETTYTLTCQSTQGPQSKQATVRILPSFRER